MRLAVLVLTCAGCAQVFDLEHIGPAPECAAGDEDCDGQLDAVDSCPADADLPTADDDADAVGDACDPDRGMAGNRIVLFDGFGDNSQAWTITNGGWQLADGEFTQPEIGDARVELAVSATTPSVEAIVTQLDTLATGLVAVYGASNGSELKCSVVRDPAAGTEHLRLEAFLTFMETELTGTGTLRIEGGQRQDGTLYCRARRGTNFDVSVTAAVLGPQTIDHIGMITSGAATAVSSITLFDVP